MEDSGPTASIFLFLLLILIDVFLYGFGAAITSLNEKEVERKAEEEKDKKSVRLLQIINDPLGYANTVQFVLSLVNMVAGAFCIGLVTARILEWLNSLKGHAAWLQRIPAGAVWAAAVIIAFLALLYILLSIGVLLPKRLAVRAPEKWAYACVYPMYFLMRLLSPFTALVIATVKGILYLFGVKGPINDNDVTEEEIIDMLHEGHEQGVIEESEAEMISNIFAFGDKEAQDIMVHRNNINAIDGNTGLQEAISFMLSGINSRYPVYEENIDHIIGILHMKDALRYQREHEDTGQPIKELPGLLREPAFVPQTKNVDELFKNMRQKKLQMVIVVDEYGQTDGLIAMEDILEEIVGNIQDEYDEDQNYIEEKSADEYVIDGKTPLEELEERFDIRFDTEEFETLNGYLISKLDKIPEPDEQFDVDCAGYNFKILSVQNKMIASVLVTRLPKESDEADASAQKPAEKSAGESALDEKEK